MKLYRIEVQLCATVYVKATGKAAALEAAKGLKDCGLDVETGEGVPISGLRLDDPKLPDLSLSPAMTCHGVWPGTDVERCD